MLDVSLNFNSVVLLLDLTFQFVADAPVAPDSQTTYSTLATAATGK
jgi:hypothetical protein